MHIIHHEIMNMRRGIRENAGTYLRGLMMGACDIIPGVSGGTIALITGIYERLIGAIGAIDPGSLKHVLHGDLDAFRVDLEKIDLLFLVVLLAGIATSFLAMSGVILDLLRYHGVETYSFFLGLIIASAVVLFREIRSPGVAGLAFFLTGTVVGFLLASPGHLDPGHSLPVIFLTGMVAICAMILPGISGAYITLVLNQYEFLLAAIGSISLPEIFTFILGGLTGLLLFTKALKYLLKNHHTMMIAFLTGLMLGATRMLYDKAAVSGDVLFDGGPFFFIAGIIAMGLVEYAKRRYENVSA
ncbi:MAG: putative rane protein [Methanofollis sp.]|nr:putative rane protein [Methanofollis sp.]